MRSRGAVLALVALALTAVLAPAAAWADAQCAEDEADDCCVPCGVLCSCCAGMPRVAPDSGAAGGHPGLDAGPVDPGRLAAPPSPSPRDILHVPKPSPFAR